MVRAVCLPLGCASPVGRARGVPGRRRLEVHVQLGRCAGGTPDPGDSPSSGSCVGCPKGPGTRLFAALHTRRPTCRSHTFISRVASVTRLTKMRIRPGQAGSTAKGTAGPPAPS